MGRSEGASVAVIAVVLIAGGFFVLLLLAVVVAAGAWLYVSDVPPAAPPAAPIAVQSLPVTERGMVLPIETDADGAIVLHGQAMSDQEFRARLEGIVQDNPGIDIDFEYASDISPQRQQEIQAIYDSVVGPSATQNELPEDAPLDAGPPDEPGS